MGLKFNESLCLLVSILMFGGGFGCSQVSVKSETPSAAVQKSLPVAGAVSTASEEKETLQIIDVHVHTKFDGGNEPVSHIPMTREQFFKELKENNVVGAVAMTGQAGENYHDLASHRVIHCGGVEKTVNVKRLEEGLKSRKYRCIKVYLGYVHQWAHAPAYQPVYQLARKYKVPVVFHTGDTYSTKGKLKYSDPLTIDEVAVDYPDVNFVIAHSGNPWIESAAEVAYKNPNVYLDGSALLIGDLNKSDPLKVQMYVERPLNWIFGYLEDPSKLMFGSDWPLTNIKSYIEAFKRAIPKEHWKAVFHDNAVQVFGIEPQR